MKRLKNFLGVVATVGGLDPGRCRSAVVEMLTDAMSSVGGLDLRRAEMLLALLLDSVWCSLHACDRSTQLDISFHFDGRNSCCADDAINATTSSNVMQWKGVTSGAFCEEWCRGSLVNDRPVKTDIASMNFFFGTGSKRLLNMINSSSSR